MLLPKQPHIFISVCDHYIVSPNFTILRPISKKKTTSGVWRSETSNRRLSRCATVQKKTYRGPPSVTYRTLTTLKVRNWNSNPSEFPSTCRKRDLNQPPTPPTLSDGNWEPQLENPCPRTSVGTSTYSGPSSFPNNCTCSGLHL